MGKFAKQSQELLTFIGGKENIQSVTHCVTRMRFVLFDEDKVDNESIKNLSCVKGTVFQSGQFQVIIGNEVSKFYDDFMNVVSGKDEEKENTNKKTFLQVMMRNLGDIFAPLIPALICGGLFLGLQNLFSQGDLISQYTFFNQLNTVFHLISQAIFSLLPVGIVWSVTKKMQGTEILGIVLGLVLVMFKEMNFQGQVLVALTAGFVLVYIERILKKITPATLNIIIVPFFSLLLSTLILFIAGPLIAEISKTMVIWIQVIFNSPLGILLGAFIGGGYAVFVMTGLHHITIIFDVMLSLMIGGTILWPLIALSNISQGASTMAMTLVHKKHKKEYFDAGLSCFMGVTEPALFGVNLKYHYPLICGMIGSALAGSLSVYFKVKAYSIGVGGLLGIISIQLTYWKPFILAMSIALIIPFLLTYFYGKSRKEEINFVSPMSGEMIPLDKVEDQVFSQGLMGEGFAIELADNKVVAPFDGEIIMTFPTKHAYGIRSKEGLEVLIHIGMDTVQLNGEGFESYVKVGDEVKKGQLIAKVDIEYIKKQRKSLVSPVVFTSKEQIEIKATGKVECLSKNIIQIRGSEV